MHHIKNHKTLTRGPVSVWYDLCKTPREEKLNINYLFFFDFELLLKKLLFVDSYLQCWVWLAPVREGRD